MEIWNDLQFCSGWRIFNVLDKKQRSSSLFQSFPTLTGGTSNKNEGSDRCTFYRVFEAKMITVRAILLLIPYSVFNSNCLLLKNWYILGVVGIK